MSIWIKSVALALGLAATGASANTSVVVHDHEGAPIADVTITGDAAKTLYDFLFRDYETTQVLSGKTVTTRLGYNISCSKIDETAADGAATSTYRCDQRLTKDGTATPGQIDPIIGGGN